MGKRRPINRRPWRRPPWKLRWIDGNSDTLEFDTQQNIWIPCRIRPGTVSCVGDPVATLNWRELLHGETDLEWLDGQECIIERIVGTISITARTAVRKASGDENLDWHRDAFFNFAAAYLPLVRMGLVVQEDIAESEGAAPPALFGNDSLQDGEWMWLHQHHAYPMSHFFVINTLETPNTLDTSNFVEAMGRVDIPVDCRVNRKLGRRDRLVLAHEWAHVVAPNATFDEELESAVNLQPMLRCLVKMK